MKMVQKKWRLLLWNARWDIRWLTWIRERMERLMISKNGVTVNDLLTACQRQVLKGNGDKYVFISSDEEGNSFNQLFYLFADDPDDIKEILEWSYPLNEIDEVAKKGVLLG